MSYACLLEESSERGGVVCSVREGCIQGAPQFCCIDDASVLTIWTIQVHANSGDVFRA
jgi:hypothetical protein